MGTEALTAAVRNAVRRKWTQGCLLVGRATCYMRGTHRIQVMEVKPSPTPSPDRGPDQRKVVTGACIHCGYSMSADLTTQMAHDILDAKTNTLILGSRMPVPVAKRLRWLWEDLKRVP